ncbi:MAG: hypothetical protein WD382_08070 [Halofilum sp. (in: g-proteobacteria)]
MAVRSVVRAVGVLSCGLLLEQMAVAGGVHRCETADGLVTYSDTGCLSEPADRGGVDEPTAERVAEDTDDTRASDEVEWTHARAKREYGQRRQALLDELDNLPLGPNQEPAQLLENRARHRFLIRAIGRLDARWREYKTGAREAPERATKQHLREFEQRLRRLQRRHSNAIDYLQIHVDDATYTCQWARGEVSCW